MCLSGYLVFFVLNDTATTEIYTYGHTLALHDALPISGEGALFMAEQLAFQQLGGNRPAVDRHERLVAARRMLMDRAGHHFLAGARFAQDRKSTRLNSSH